jgi:hypothetical protein
MAKKKNLKKITEEPSYIPFQVRKARKEAKFQVELLRLAHAAIYMAQGGDFSPCVFW